jgi:uncharacterized protein (TIGR00369 family)
MNPDQVLLRSFKGEPLALDSNPLAAALQTRLLALDAATGTVRLGFHPGAQFVQGRGVVQGGIVGTMLDFAAAFAALAKLPDGQTAATATITIGFHSAVRAGPLVAVGTVERAGKRLMFTRAQLQSEDGQALAVATAVMSVLTDTPPAA